MAASSARPRLVILSLLLVGVISSSCEDSVSPPPGVEEPFSAFGILNPRLTRQTMLVSPTASQLFDFSDSIDAIVTSTDLSSGQSRIWHDSVVVGPRGQRDHIFYSDFRPDFGSEHTIQVRRSDGATSSVDVRIPSQVALELEDDGTHRLRFRVIGDGIRVLRAIVTYGVRYYSYDVAFCEQILAFYELPLDDEIEETPDGAVIGIDMYLHEQLLRSYYAMDYDAAYPDTHTGLGLTHMKIEVTIGNDSWSPPGGVFDLNVLSSPRTLANVSNGYGFIGSGYNQDRALWPSKEAVQNTWFFDFLMRPPGVCVDYCGCGLNME
jgi:hypothetical protein